MLKLNEAHLRHPYHGTVFTLSHFLPRRSLPHSPYRKAAKSMGCEQLDSHVRTIQATNRIHVYGHSHLRHAAYDDGIMYVNYYHGADGGENERAPLFLIHDGQRVVNAKVPPRD